MKKGNSFPFFCLNPPEMHRDRLLYPPCKGESDQLIFKEILYIQKSYF